MPPRMYDIAILGATPAGLAAACVLGGRRSVIVLDAPSEACECPLADWAPGDLFRTPGLPKSLSKASGAAEFRRVRYHNAALDNSVEYAARGRAGFFLQSGALQKALRKSAASAGADIRTRRTWPGIGLFEDHVRLGKSRPVNAKLLIIASGCPHAIQADLSMHTRTGAQHPMSVTGLDVPLGRTGLDGKLAPNTLHVVECRERTEMGLFFAVGKTAHLRLIANSSASGARGAELSALVAGLQGRDLLPSDLVLGRAKGAVWNPPATHALDMETHVAKRCLLVGSAGGFAESVTGHSVAPGVRSGILAARAADAALRTDDPQHALMGFRDQWRESLADYLRPPGTPLQMLLPLLFVNKRILPRFTRTLLFGESI
jgi:flavin-dependent dehydrogenase